MIRFAERFEIEKNSTKTKAKKGAEKKEKSEEQEEKKTKKQWCVRERTERVCAREREEQREEEKQMVCVSECVRVRV